MARKQQGMRVRHAREREESEWEQRVVEVARVTRVTAGGKRMRFRALIVVGDHNGRVGFGLSKGGDVSQAIAKATNQAKKHVCTIVRYRDTIPHEVLYKEGASSVLLKPAPRGTGIIAGGVVRIVLELAGVGNAVSKIIGSRNKLNNVRATFGALERLQRRSPVRVLKEEAGKTSSGERTSPPLMSSI